MRIGIIDPESSSCLASTTPRKRPALSSLFQKKEGTPAGEPLSRQSLRSENYPLSVSIFAACLAFLGMASTMNHPAVGSDVSPRRHSGKPAGLIRNP
jgi:hypothetical protein